MNFDNHTLTQLVSKYEAEISVLFKEYGISKPVTPENVLKAYAVAGTPFLVDFMDLAEDDESDNFLGGLFSKDKRNERKTKRQTRRTNRNANRLANKADKGQRVEKLKGFFDKGVQLLTGAKNAVGSVHQLTQKNEPVHTESPEEIKAKEKKQNMIALGIGGGIVLILLTIFIVMRNK